MTPDQRTLLESMAGCGITSITGKPYTVTVVRPGIEVVVNGADRAEPSRLPWESIDRILTATSGGQELNTNRIDEILENPSYRHSSTMLAVVLAVRDPNRILHGRQMIEI